jgi:lysophospholipase L1-like esterase
MNFNYRISPILDNTIWYFGCSLTWGKFVDIQESAPFQLSKLINQHVDNLGICGGSPDLIYLQIQELVKKHKPKLIIIQWPADTRTFGIVDDKIINLGTWIFRDSCSDILTNYPTIATLYQKLLLEGTVQERNNVCKQNISKFVTCPIIEFSCEEFIDYASDHIHPGPLTHQLTADMLSRKVLAELG